jgi:hypothetical protein
MDFTFGIVTNGGNDSCIQQMVDSVAAENIPNYEIIIIGDSAIRGDKVTHIPFDETVKEGWTTRKKNIITQQAKYDNIMVAHDYFKVVEGWYEGQKTAGENYEIRMDKIINADGSRFRDWTLWPHNYNHIDSIVCEGQRRFALIPYDMTHLTQHMYISGGYWIGKKQFMLDNPQNENLCWGQGEDVEWSFRIRNKIKFNMNPHSSVMIVKGFKPPAFEELDANRIEILKHYN